MNQSKYKIGDLIGGKFKVLEAMAGGMGEIYLCVELSHAVPMALKTVKTLNKVQQDTFFREVSRWVALEKHPNIVRCYAIEVLDNQPFMQLEWVASYDWVTKQVGKNVSLRSRLEDGALDVQQALGLAIGICNGLAHVERKQPGMIHRDLKPDNVLLASDNVPKITDFGLAIISEPPDQNGKGGIGGLFGRRSPQQDFAGTPLYMAPEQWEGKPLDARTDLYALGCILYEMLSGHMLFATGDLQKLRTMHLQQQPAPLPSTVPQQVQAIVQRCLAKSPDERPQNAETLLETMAVVYRDLFQQEPPILTANNFEAWEHNDRGTIYDKMGRYEEALADYNRAIELDPSLMSAYSNRALTLSALQRYEEALADYDKALALNPQQHLTYFGRGQLYMQRGEQEKALADYNRAIELTPTFAGHYLMRAGAHAARQDVDAAFADYETALRLDPKNAYAYALRALTYERMGRQADALADFTRAIQLRPTMSKFYGGAPSCTCASTARRRRSQT